MPVIVEAATADTAAEVPVEVDADTDSAVKIVDTTAEMPADADTRIQLETERANKPPRIVQNAFISAFRYIYTLSRKWTLRRQPLTF